MNIAKFFPTTVKIDIMKANSLSLLFLWKTFIFNGDRLSFKWPTGIPRQDGYFQVIFIALTDVMKGNI